MQKLNEAVAVTYSSVDSFIHIEERVDIGYRYQLDTIVRTLHGAHNIKIQMEPEGIRIKLNLSEFFNDKRKYSYIFIEQNKIKDFYDLDSHIRDEFPIRGNIIFLIDNVFIPHSESIKLLHDEETLT